MSKKEKIAFERGAWFAFDVVLGWINTQPNRKIDKHSLYREVMQMRPEHLAKWKQEAKAA